VKFLQVTAASSNESTAVSIKIKQVGATGEACRVCNVFVLFLLTPTTSTPTPTPMPTMTSLEKAKVEKVVF
jgi:hypothetical protein